jgi:DNA repair protein SbcD/Mre11
MTIRILHFADAHIDMANYGRHDPQTGLPMRVMDFLKSLDTIVDTAIDEKVDVVLFAGDAYKDRSPAPTFQREWGRRIMRLSKAGIPTLLLVGNHDLSPALGRAHAIEEFSTLEVPFIHVLDRPAFLGPDKLDGLPLQILALPWVSRSGLMANLGMSAIEPGRIFEELENRLTELVHQWLDEVDPALPVVLTAHASVQGARYGGERSVMLGSDLALPRSLVCDPRLDYVALGHIHKSQNLNENSHPPVIYPGSIERVDFGEAADDKFFVIAGVSKGQTSLEWRVLDGVRPFIDRFLCLDGPENVTQRIQEILPAPDKFKGAIVRLTLEYPREWESLIDEASLREYLMDAFELHLVKRPQVDVRIRLPEDQGIGSLSALELLEKYWSAVHTDGQNSAELLKLAAEIISCTDENDGRPW